MSGIVYEASPDMHQVFNKRTTHNFSMFVSGRDQDTVFTMKEVGKESGELIIKLLGFRRERGIRHDEERTRDDELNKKRGTCLFNKFYLMRSKPV